MKTEKPVFDDIFNIQNLIISDFAVRKNRKDKRSIIKWDKNIQDNQQNLLLDVIEGRYKVSPYHETEVMLEKKRLLAILEHPDRIIQDMLLRSMKPYFDNIFIYHSYACIIGKGTTKCVTDLQKILKEDIINTKYYIQLDIFHYFPSVSHRILKRMIAKILRKDKQLIDIHNEIIDSYHTGLPIGNSTSQYYANLFISYILHKLLSTFNKCKIYVIVYMDDIIILCGDKKYLPEIRDWLNKEFAEVELRLKNPNAQVYVVRKNGIRFLGYQFYGDYTLLRKNVINKIWKSIHDFCDGKVTLEAFTKTFSSYSGMFKYANTRDLSYKMYKYLLEHTGRKFYVNNWNGKLMKISKLKGCKVRIHDITFFNKRYRIDFVYQGDSCRILTKSKKLIKELSEKFIKNRKKPFNYKFKK